MRTLRSILLEVSKPYFRVRDCKTLRDYVVLPQGYGVFGVVRIAGEDRIFETIDMDNSKYIILSTREEMVYYERYTESMAVLEMLRNYP